ncbi:MAG TPA: methyltransferase domain-containing protein [Sedimentisphaerales bacterium]|nr:methyltransferase domain-containing protein [Sedimentisphaerales bacterium]
MTPKTKDLSSQPAYETVKEYYGQVLQGTSDLKTDACCTSETFPPRVTDILPLINDEIKNKYYGCGSPVPLCIEGLNVLDLGCGTGRDCYVMSKLTGPHGFVYGIDMTQNQIAVAGKYITEQTALFGYSKPNVDFIFDYIESLHKHFEKESLHLVTSNCVINLTEDKEVIFRQVYEVLKFGGEMFFADIYTDRRVPEKISRDPVLRGECLGGALYYRDFERIVRKVGFADPRVFSKRIVRINNEEIQDLVGNINFWSITYRLWKIRDLEDACEDYGHTADYNGRIPESPFKFQLDSGHLFYRNRPERVCGNTALMLSQTRFRKYFEVSGGFREHFGAFEGCQSRAPNTKADPADSSCCS